MQNSNEEVNQSRLALHELDNFPLFRPNSMVDGDLAVTRIVEAIDGLENFFKEKGVKDVFNTEKDFVQEMIGILHDPEKLPLTDMEQQAAFTFKLSNYDKYESTIDAEYKYRTEVFKERLTNVILNQKWENKSVNRDKLVVAAFVLEMLEKLEYQQEEIKPHKSNPMFGPEDFIVSMFKEIRRETGVSSENEQSPRLAPLITEFVLRRASGDKDEFLGIPFQRFFDLADKNLGIEKRQVQVDRT